MAGNHWVWCRGFANLPARMAEQASAMYAQNMANLLRHVHGKGKAGSFIPNLYGALDQGEEGDIVSRSIVCCKSGNPVGTLRGLVSNLFSSSCVRKSLGPRQLLYLMVLKSCLITVQS